MPKKTFLNNIFLQRLQSYIQILHSNIIKYTKYVKMTINKQNNYRIKEMNIAPEIYNFTLLLYYLHVYLRCDNMKR